MIDPVDPSGLIPFFRSRTMQDDALNISQQIEKQALLALYINYNVEAMKILEREFHKDKYSKQSTPVLSSSIWMFVLICADSCQFHAGFC